MASLLTWLTSSSTNNVTDSSDLLKTLLQEPSLGKKRKKQGLIRSQSATELVFTEQTIGIPVYTDNFTNYEAKEPRKRFSLMARRKSRCYSTENTRKMSVSSSDSEFSVHVKTNSKRFSPYSVWKDAFEFKKTRKQKEDSDKIEGFMIKKFMNVAKLKLKQKLMLLILEKMSQILTVGEKQVLSDERLSLFVNSLNGYILCLRFSHAKFNKNLKFQKTDFNLNFNNLNELILSQQEINKKLQILNKLNSKKQKKIKVLQELKKEAVYGIYTSFILFLLSLKNETKAQDVSTLIINTVYSNIDILIDNNKDTIISSIKQFIDINNNFIVSILDNQVDSIIKYIKIYSKQMLDIVKKHHMVPFFKLLEDNGIFKKKWKVDVKTRHIILDNHDFEMIEQLETVLSKMYIQSEFFVHCFTTIVLKNIEKLLA